MAEYKPRLTAPSTTDKNYIKTTSGGYNYCIEIKNGSCLPNCVGYAWGRWREILGKYHNLSRGNAENWWGNTGDGYLRGQTPKVGAVMCWRKGLAGNAADGAGHVAIVERINDDGSITYSQSNYGGTRWELKTKSYPYSLGSSYTFQGFIYLPISFEENTNTQNSNLTTSVANNGITLVAQDVIKGKYGTGHTNRKENIYKEVRAEVNRLTQK